MAFQFRLESVLKHRKHQEDVALGHYGRRLHALSEAEAQIAWLEKELIRARDQLARREAEGITARDYILANEHVTVMRLKLMGQKARLPKLQAEVEKARLVLMAARKKKKALEVLKDRHRDAWAREQLVLEQKLLDEAAVGAFARKALS